MARNSANTRAAILDAAVTEFAAHGFAGARIDKIADAAGSNKRMIYVYYQAKEGLFTATLDRVIQHMVETVPVTEDNLPGYAGALFDYIVANPEALRLTMWRHLERPEAGPEVGELYSEKIQAIRRVIQPKRSGSSPSIPPVDLLVLVQGMASAWLISPLDLLKAEGPDPMSPARLAVHRAALVAAVERLAAPQHS